MDWPASEPSARSRFLDLILGKGLGNVAYAIWVRLRPKTSWKASMRGSRFARGNKIARFANVEIELSRFSGLDGEERLRLENGARVPLDRSSMYQKFAAALAAPSIKLDL
jgi:hypothetical protein